MPPPVLLPVGPEHTDYPSDPAIIALLESAKQAENEGRLTDAETKFVRAISFGADPEAFTLFGRFLLRRGRLTQAKGMLDRLLQVAPGFNVPPPRPGAVR